MLTCTPDGLGWNTVPCAGHEVCLSSLPGGVCEPAHSATRSISENYGPVVLLERPDGSTCSASLLTDDTVLTNHHCCPGGGACDGDGSIIVTAYRNLGSADDAGRQTFPVDAVVWSDPELDAAVLRVMDAPGAELGHVILARGAPPIGSSVYLLGHPRGRPVQGTIGRVYAYADSVVFQYSDAMKVKRAQLLYGAHADLGSSGSAVFLDGIGLMVGLHHSGSVRPEAFGLQQELTDGFTSLLAATNAEAIASALETAGVPFSSVSLNDAATSSNELHGESE